jgi:hypothetical protein
VVEGRSGFRYGESEILKLLRVPRGSVRGKMAKRRRRSVALQMALGTSALVGAVIAEAGCLSVVLL